MSHNNSATATQQTVVAPSQKEDYSNLDKGAVEYRYNQEWFKMFYRKQDSQILNREYSYRTQVREMYAGVTWMWQDSCPYTASIGKPYGHMPSRKANDDQIEKLEKRIAKCEQDIHDLDQKVKELSEEMTRRKNNGLAKRSQPY